jgi:hypothetical protein
MTSQFSAKRLAEDDSNPYSIGNPERKYDLLYAGVFTANELRVAGANIAQLKSVLVEGRRKYTDDADDSEFGIPSAGFSIEELSTLSTTR